MKFSGDYIYFIKNIIISITIALWEINEGAYDF